MNTQLDIEFKNVKKQKWLPFIGNHYLTIPEDRKLLIVGESHYHDNSQQSIEKHNSPDFTRQVIEELAIKKWYWGTKIFPNFHRAMFANDEFNTERFWNLTSFYNFVQRPMETNKGRPNYDDFYNGWMTFFETIKISKPSTCLFIGTEASNSLQHAINDSDFEVVNFTRDDKISRTYPRRATIKKSDDQLIELIFIQHTSQYFSWGKWNDYIKQKLSQQLEWFEEKMKE
jgi:hypothetical protein